MQRFVNVNSNLSAPARPMHHLVMKWFCALAIAVALAGCAETEFTPYRGAQQSWPTGSGAFVQTRFAVPVYLGPPDRAYAVVGYVQVENARTGLLYGSSQSVRAAANEAKRQGADAIVILDRGTDVAGSYTSGSAYAITRYGAGLSSGTASGSSFTTPIRRGHARALAIKWR